VKNPLHCFVSLPPVGSGLVKVLVNIDCELWQEKGPKGAGKRLSNFALITIKQWLCQATNTLRHFSHHSVFWGRFRIIEK